MTGSILTRARTICRGNGPRKHRNVEKRVKSFFAKVEINRIAVRSAFTLRIDDDAMRLEPGVGARSAREKRAVGKRQDGPRARPLKAADAPERGTSSQDQTQPGI